MELLKTYLPKVPIIEGVFGELVSQDADCTSPGFLRLVESQLEFLEQETGQVVGLTVFLGQCVVTLQVYITVIRTVLTLSHLEAK